MIDTEIVGDPTYLQKHYLVIDIFLRPKWNEIVLEPTDVRAAGAATEVSRFNQMENFYRVMVF